MKYHFSIDKKTLLPLLSAMQPICTKRTTLDATSMLNFHVGHRELLLKSTDLEVSLQATCFVEESSFTDPLSFLVSGRRIFDIVRELEGLITFELSNNRLELTAQGVNVSLNIKDTQEFPLFPERIENLMSMATADLVALLESVSFLIPQNNSNPALNGLFMEIAADGLKLTATDGHCLAQAQAANYALTAPRSWLIPRRAIFELKKLLENFGQQTIFVGTCAHQLVFSGEVFNFFTKLLSSPFPEYRPIMEKDAFIPARIDRSQFVKTLRRSACLLSGQFLATKFTFKPENLKVSLYNKEVGSLEEELMLQDFNAHEMEVRFYTPYLLNGIQALPEGALQFYLKDSAKPIIFESQKDQLKVTYLVMPVSPTATVS
jgi:DNA polymerase III subunit beta